MPAVLSVSKLGKRFGSTRAVRNVSFTVGKGEIVGLLGANGAGKTTTINMILGVLEPSSGTITIEGIDLAKNRSLALEHTNFAAVYAQLPGNLTVIQNLRVFALLYGVKDPEKKISHALKEFGLIKFRDVKTGVLSSGEQTRVSLAKAMLNDPRLLLLDEPTASLDPSNASEIRKRIRRLATSKEMAILWTSHNMYEVEEVCDRVLIMSKGNILVEGDPKTLPKEHKKKSMEELFIAIAKERIEPS